MARDGETLIELMGWLARAGRVGGAICLTLGALVLGSGLVPYFVSPWALAVGGTLALFGAYLLISGGKQWRRDERFQPLPREQLEQAVRTTALPFAVCMDCRLVVPIEVALGRCPRCEAASSCLEVASDSERKTALAAVAA